MSADRRVPERRLCGHFTRRTVRRWLWADTGPGCIAKLGIAGVMERKSPGDDTRALSSRTAPPGRVRNGGCGPAEFGALTRASCQLSRKSASAGRCGSSIAPRYTAARSPDAAIALRRRRGVCRSGCELEAVERGECSRLMLCLPPGAGKNSYTSMVYPAWYLGRNPTHSVIAASHTAELAERFGRRVRNSVRLPGAQKGIRGRPLR